MLVTIACQRRKDKLAPLWYVVASGVVSVLALAAFKLHVEKNTAPTASKS